MNYEGDVLDADEDDGVAVVGVGAAVGEDGVEGAIAIDGGSVYVGETEYSISIGVHP